MGFQNWGSMGNRKNTGHEIEIQRSPFYFSKLERRTWLLCRVCGSLAATSSLWVAGSPSPVAHAPAASRRPRRRSREPRTESNRSMSSSRLASSPSSPRGREAVGAAPSFPRLGRWRPPQPPGIPTLFLFSGLFENFPQ